MIFTVNTKTKSDEKGSYIVMPELTQSHSDVGGSLLKFKGLARKIRKSGVTLLNKGSKIYLNDLPHGMAVIETGYFTKIEYNYTAS